jgi:hypothetical protein
MRTSAHGITILMRQFLFEWDYGAGRMAFPIPVLAETNDETYKVLLHNIND